MGLRRERLADEIRDVLAMQFRGGLLNDPRLADVTISAVKLSPDLQIASVYFRVYPGADQEIAKKALGRATGVLKKEIGSQIQLRRMPELRFFYDESVERGARIEELLREIQSH